MTRELHQPIEAFIQATNNHNTDGFLATLTDDALITDEGQNYRGLAAIKEWSDERYIGANVALQVSDVIDRNGKSIVTLQVDGDFDKTGLPDPFYMDFHFTLDQNKICLLNIRLPGA